MQRALSAVEKMRPAPDGAGLIFVTGSGERNAPTVEILFFAIGLGRFRSGLFELAGRSAFFDAADGGDADDDNEMYPFARRKIKFNALNGGSHIDHSKSENPTLRFFGLKSAIFLPFWDTLPS